MKPKLKYLYAIAAVVVLCGFKSSNRDGGEIPCQEQMETLHYKNHTYICYRFKGKGGLGNGSYGYGGASIVHDPDCKCGKGGGK
ncbi:MAG: hypothetical protein K2K45_07625 [Muribaculaceae bacterium]|nr:hypothetical protein [Muribaculaceae bacterium]